MRVGLVNVDSKIPNLALMKLSAWRKKQGDEVKLYDPETDRPDLIYASKVFNFTKDYLYYPGDCEIKGGGTGYDIATALPEEVESMYPDYELFNCEYAMGFTTRGCIRKCPFCLVPKKEGKIKVVGDIYDFWHGQENLMLLDNNLTAIPEQFEKICLQLTKEKIKVAFSQGLDIRLIDEDKAKLLSKVKRWKRIHFAFDSLGVEGSVRRGIKLLTKYIHPDNLTFYVLVGFDSTHHEDLYRIELLRSLKVNPYVMPFNKQDRRQAALARWVNRPAIFRSCTWNEYKRKA